MSLILPNLQLIGIGLVGGFIVNYLSDFLLVYRDLIPDESKISFNKASYWRSLFLVESEPAWGNSWRWRVVFVWAGYMVASFGLDGLASDQLQLWWAYPLAMLLGIILVIDIEQRLILNEVVLVGAIGGAALGVYLHGWLATLIGGVFGFGLMWAIYGLGILYLRYLNRRDGDQYDPDEDVALGFGDVKLAGVMGLLLGFPGVWIGFMLTLFAGGVVGVFVLLAAKIRGGYRANLAMPYGPFMVFSIIVLLFFRAYL